MSERSKRRDLEIAVIDAAVAWAAANRIPREEAEGSVIYTNGTLREAVRAYCEYGLATTGKPRVGLRAPETSHDAAEWAKKFAVTDAGRVFREIYYVWRRNRAFAENREWGDPREGLTTDEVEEMLNRTHQSISARVNNLKEAGWIVDSGQKRETRSGAQAIVWTPSEAAKQFVDEYGMPIPVSRANG